MKLRLSAPEKILALSISFTFLLLAVRVIYSGTLSYLFYPWNLFLAVVPIYFSSKLTNHTSINRVSLLLIVCWLLLFPNAPYVLTDIFHFYKRSNIPLWYDLLLVVSGSLNGLMAGFISLMQVDAFLSRTISSKWRVALIGIFMFAASDGIYLGRFLRFNSWDVITNPRRIFVYGADYIFMPEQHLKAWVFSIICTTLLLLIYYTIKNLPALLHTGRQ